MYEAPHRIKKTLALLGENLPRREVLVGKELTKLYERTWRGRIKDVAHEFDLLPSDDVRGEFVLAVAPEKYVRK